ncbi:ATP-binding protein [[Eubacterium] cellulosolvens]
MSTVIGVAGKGGVGKSTFSSLVIRGISKIKENVILAVDADSNSTLGKMLGVPVEQTIGNLREDLVKDSDSIPPGMSKFEWVKYQLQLAMTEGEKFDLITMGRPEGPGCYCYINNILRTYMDALADKYSYVVIDNEAGMEHLSRRTTRKLDKFFVVTDFSPIGFETAERIRELGASLDIKINDIYLVVNRVPETVNATKDHPRIKELVKTDLYSEIFFIPNDEQLLQHAFEGKSLLELGDNSAVVHAVDNILKSSLVI